MATTRLVGTCMNAICFFFAITACVLSSCQISHHIYYSHNAKTRRYIIRILLMIIVYSITAWCGLFFPKISIWLDVIRNTYESLVIYSFYQLLICSLGGYRNIQQILYSQPIKSIPHIFPFKYCCKPWILESHSFIRNTTLGVLQFCFVQLFVAIITFIMEWSNVMNKGEFEYNKGYIWMVIIRSSSQMWALYCLLLFYHTLTKIPTECEGYQLFITMRALPKFLCIKGIVFFTYWQSVIISALVYCHVIKTQNLLWTAENIGQAIQNSIICIEMVLFAMAHIYAFRIKDFQNIGDEPILPAWRVLCDVANVSDLVGDAKNISNRNYLIKQDVPDAAITNRNKLKYYHVLIIIFTNTMFALLTKSFCAFIAFIGIAYGYNYTLIAMSLAFGAFISSFTFIMELGLFHLKSNTVFFVLCVLECIILFILWFPNKILFVIGVVMSCLIERISFRFSNIMINTLMNDEWLSHRYILALNASNTIAAFLFIPTGFIIQYVLFWSYLEILFVVFVILAILNLLITPKISINQYNLQNVRENQQNISIKHDLNILWNIKQYRIMILIVIFVFIGWGYFYTSFGVWLKDIIDLDAAHWGIAAGLMEGIAGLMIIALIKCWRKKNEQEINILDEYDDDEEEEQEQDIDDVNTTNNNDRLYTVNMGYIMICSCGISLISILMLVILNYVQYFEQLLVYIVIGAYFSGFQVTMFVVSRLNISEIPRSQQTISFVIIGMMQSIAMFIGQLTVAPMFLYDGMRLESILLLIIYFIIGLSAIGLNKMIKNKKLKSELLWINENNVTRYT